MAPYSTPTVEEETAAFALARWDEDFIAANTLLYEYEDQEGCLDKCRDNLKCPQLPPW
jgi:hypothetical protein